MGKTAANVSNITSLVRQAAAKGAKIIVTPECAVQGYLDPMTWTSWSKVDGRDMAVRKVAEPVPGLTTALMGRLAAELGVYLCVGLIESATNGFFNAQVLLSPTGAIVAHHRKRALWTPGDSDWCTKGDRPVQIVSTEYGNLGLMICFDFHVLPPLLAERKADIVLYSVGWYGPNEKTWFSSTFPAKAVVPYGFHVVAANWSSATASQKWPGRGYSCIINRGGHVLAMSEHVQGNDIVIADLPIRLGIGP
jgi:predicted amidohydrolase